MYATGMRVSEIVNLKLDNIDFKIRSVWFFGKGKKERLVTFGEEALDALTLWLNTARKNMIQYAISSGKIKAFAKSDWLFIGRNTYETECVRGGVESR